MADELFDARNALVIGNYDQVISECSSAKTSLRKSEDIARFNVEKELLIACAQIGLGQYDVVLHKYSSENNPRLKAVYEYARLNSTLAKNPVLPESEEELSPDVQEPLTRLTTAATEVQPGNEFIAILACSALLYVHDYTGAIALGKTWLKGLEAPHGALATQQRIELHALVVEGLIQINRIDQVSYEIAAMEKANDEALVTLLYVGIHALYEAQHTQQKESYQKAFDSFTDVIERSGHSVKVLNLLALSLVGMQMYDKAEKALLDALAIKSSDENTLVNLAVVSAHLGKQSDIVDRYLAQASAAGGLWDKEYTNMSTVFDAAAANHMVE
ncbi:unnamed protein product [Phytomonas sp. EM1]|nr:unnamed protein product [Phytomonas sp. EM1]|eukprot:CCW62823.1 unnamed protein product [Phytomonas sp. isolate EM1]